jgi:hypothetical protein
MWGGRDGSLLPRLLGCAGFGFFIDWFLEILGRRAQAFGQASEVICYRGPCERAN